MNRTTPQVDFKRLIAAGALIFHFTSGYAQESPDGMVMRVTDEVLNIVRTDKQIRNSDLVKATTVAETVVAPHIDFSRLAVDLLPGSWSSATTSQQERVTGEIKTFLVRMLATSLSTLGDERVVLDTSVVAPNGKDALVRCKVLSPGKSTESLEFALEKKDNAWKVYEMKLGGVSVFGVYRDQFSPIVRTQGIDGLISTLEKRNSSARTK